jgi:hypothetical protein
VYDSSSEEFVWAGLELTDSGEFGSACSGRAPHFVRFDSATAAGGFEQLSALGGVGPDSIPEYLSNGSAGSDFGSDIVPMNMLDLEDDGGCGPHDWVQSVLAAPGGGVGDTSVYLLDVTDNLSTTLACPKFFAGPIPGNRVSGVEAVRRELQDSQHANRRSPFFRIDVHLLLFADGPVLASTCSNPGCDCHHTVARSDKRGEWSQQLSDPQTDVSCDRFDQLFPVTPGGDLLCGCARAAVSVLLTAEAAYPAQPGPLAERYYDFVSEMVPFGALCI